MSESALNINCENTEQVVESKAASNHLWKILKSMWLSNRKEILKIYNRIKKKDESLTNREIENFKELINDSEFEVAYEEYTDSLNIGKEDREKVSFWNIRITIVEFIHSIKVMQILKKDWKQYHRDWWVTYWFLHTEDKSRKKRNRSESNNNFDYNWDNETHQRFSDLKKSRTETTKDHNYYYEVIDWNDYFEVWRNLKSWRYILIDKNKWEVIFDSDEIFYIWEKMIEWIYFLDWTRNEKVWIISEFWYERVDYTDWVHVNKWMVLKISQNNYKIEIKCINKVAPYRRVKWTDIEINWNFLYYSQENLNGIPLNYKIDFSNWEVTEA